MQLAPSESTFCLFEQVDWQGDTLKSCLDGIVFSEGANDSLAKDNSSGAVKSRENQINGLFVGEEIPLLKRHIPPLQEKPLSKQKQMPLRIIMW